MSSLDSTGGDVVPAITGVIYLLSRGRRSTITYRVLLELDNDLPADRLFTLLRRVERVGSINRAASDLQISYRHAWGLVKSAEERLSFALLEKQQGGVNGGGAQLTGAARQLLRKYDLFRAQVGIQLEHIFTSDRDIPADATRPLLLATSIGPAESGIVTALAEAYHQATGTMMRHIAAGSGQAFAIAREGRADLVLTHAPDLEAAFMDDGYGVARFPLMQNEFLLAGPKSDPAGVSQAKSARDALQRCAAVSAPFLTRGDQSGTHLREIALWRAAGIMPGGTWYRTCERGSMGSLATLRCAEAEQAYTLIDRATYLLSRPADINLSALFSGDPELRNEFVLIPVSARRFPNLQEEEAVQFAMWAIAKSGQDLIAQFGRVHYGEPLFTPLHPH